MKTIPSAIDQGHLNNCTAHAIGYGLKSAHGMDFDVNWLMGANIQVNNSLPGILDALTEHGSLPIGDYSTESTVTSIAKEWFAKNRSKLAHIAAKYKVAAYYEIKTEAELRSAFLPNWYVVFAVSVPPAKDSPVGDDGVFRPYDYYGEKTFHAMSAWGVNPDGTIRILNSWGTSWGDNGQANMTAADIMRGAYCYAYRIDGPPEKTKQPEKEKKTLRESKYIAGLPEGKAAVLRAEKETSSEQIGTIKKDTPVTVLAIEGSRALVTTGLAGWMDKKYLVDILGETPEPEAPAEPTKPAEPFTPAPAGVHTHTDKQKDVRLTEHFTVGDFWAYSGHKQIKLDTGLAKILEKVYAKFGVRPLMRNKNMSSPSKPYEPQPSAGYRDSLNWSGSKTSQHCYGKGLDFYVPGVTAYKLAQFVETLPEVGGIGLYLKKSGELKRVTHIHIDTRVKRARWGWNGQTSGTNTPGFGGIKCTFRKGNKSAAIEEIQITLNALGYKCGTPDGHWGDATDKAFKAWQKANGLKADGVYGEESNKIMGLFNW